MLRTLYSLWGLCASQVLYPLAERRLKRSISPKLRVLRRESSLPFVRRRQMALERLVASLQHAGSTVPYYRELFAAHSFMPEKVRTDIRYFEELPYLTKDILREQGRRLISEAYTHKLVREQKTGSSTGLAATIYYDQESLDWTAAQNILMLEWAGKRRHDREAHLSTRFDALSQEQIRNERRKCLVLNRYNIYTSGFGDAAQEQLLQDLRRARAVVVQGHPSSLFALARYLERHGKKAPGLFEIFVSTGEMLQNEQRRLIESVFSVRVSDRYGACEFGVMGQECAKGLKGQLMICDSLVWPETRKAAQHEGDELVFTNLRNRAMPLIRYCMGDLGRLEEHENGWRITELAGRVHDCVDIEGVVYPTHYIQDILDRCGPVFDFQIVAREGRAVELRLVTPVAEWETVSAAARRHFPSLPARRIDPEELVFVGARGKFSYILREQA